MAGPRTARGAPLVASAPPNRKRVLLWVAAGLVALAGVIVFVRFVVLSDSSEKFELAVDIPESAPYGEPVPIAYGVAAGDEFSTIVFATNRILGAAEGAQTKDGMALDVRMTWKHVVRAREGAPGTTSEVAIKLHRADTHIPRLRDAYWMALGSEVAPYTLTFDRDADGKPVKGSVRGGPVAAEQRYVLDGCMAGLGDLATNWLPDRPVRLGEAWELSEGVDVLPNVERIVRSVVQRQRKGPDENPAGFPKAVTKARVQAVSLEDRDGEPCLKLRIALSMKIEGNVVPPAIEGWISGAGRIDGWIWVSRKTGIVWGLDYSSDVISTYRNSELPTERKAHGHVDASTKRVAKTPPR
jgi:hypothetical protein